MQQPTSNSNGDFSFVLTTKKQFEDDDHDSKKKLEVASSIPINANNTDTDDNCDEGSTTGFRAKQVLFNQSKQNHISRPQRGKGKVTTTQSTMSNSTRNESCSADQQSTSMQASSVN